VFVAEGLSRLITLHHVRDAVVACTIGLLVPILLGRSTKDRLHGLLAVIPVAAVGVGAYQLLDAILELVFSHP
jgi:Na+/citrate or Na+/malate symporter